MGNLGRAGYGASLDGMVSLFCSPSGMCSFVCFSGLTLTTLAMLELHPTRLSMDCPLPHWKVDGPTPTTSYLTSLANDYRDVLAKARAIQDPNTLMAPMSDVQHPKSIFSKLKFPKRKARYLNLGNGHLSTTIIRG